MRSAKNRCSFIENHDIPVKSGRISTLGIHEDSVHGP